jgi:undecaprenyl-diphosphatase
VQSSNSLSTPRRLRAIVSLLSIFFMLYKLVRHHKTDGIDRVITRALQEHQEPVLSDVLHAASWAGFPPQSRTIPWLMPLLWLATGRRQEAFFQMLGWGTGAISFLVKMRMKRPRPSKDEFYFATANIGGSSFPSGHVINYIGVYGTFAYLVANSVDSKLLRRMILLPIALMLALVGPSRIYLGHHWATDTTASYLLGTSYLLALAGVYNEVKNRDRS